MTEADGALPATRQPDKKPSAAGTGARDNVGGSTLHPSSHPHSQGWGSSTTGAQQPHRLEPSTTAKSLRRKSPKHFASWPELERACTHAAGAAAPICWGQGSPLRPPLCLPEPAGSSRQHSLQPSHAAVRAAQGESGCGKAIAWDAPACPTFLLNIASQVLPIHPSEPARKSLGTRLPPVWSSSPCPGMLSPPLPVLPVPPFPIPQRLCHLSYPCPRDPRQRRRSGVEGPVAPRRGSQTDGPTCRSCTTTPLPSTGSQPKNRREHASLAPAAAEAVSTGTVPLTALAAGRQRRMKRQSGARHARSLSPSASQTAGKIRRLCRD